MTTIRESGLPNLVYRGKVRDTHDLDDELFLMVVTDRISAFDVVLPTTIPDKGAVLCQMSRFWFGQTADLVPNHFVAVASDRTDLDVPANIARQAMVVRKAQRIDVECVVRGYITGSAWSEYKRAGTVSGMPHAFRPLGGRQVSRAAFHAHHQGRGGPRREHHDGAGRGAGRERRPPNA